MPKKLIHFYLMQDYDTVILQVTALHEHPGLSTKGFLLKGKIQCIDKYQFWIYRSGTTW